MNGLLNKDNVVLDLPAFYESTLVLWDDSGEDCFKSIGNDFGYNLVAEIAKGDWPESGEGSGPFSFGIRVRKAEFVLPPILQVAWECLTILNRSSLIISQQLV